MALTIPTTSSPQDLNKRLTDFRKGVALSARPIDLKQVDASAITADTNKENSKLWRVDSTSGNIGRDDGLFFKIQGLEVKPQGMQATSSYFQPVLKETAAAGGALTGVVILIADRKSGDILIDMKVESGSDPERQFTTLAPSLQVSTSNLELAKVNKQSAPALLGVLIGLKAFESPPVEVQQDPGRFLNKRNGNRIVFVDNKKDISVENMPNLLWTKPSHLDDVININESNEFLWQLRGLLACEQRKQKTSLSFKALFSSRH